jgi:signal transduction histidine kinase
LVRPFTRFRQRVYRNDAHDELKEAFSLLEATLESTADGILVVNADGKITRLNQQFVRMWRIPPEIVRSGDDSRALELVVDQLKEPEEFVRKVRELYADPSALSFDILLFKDGRTFERYSKPQIVDGVPVGRVWSFRDVTERNRLDEMKDNLLSAVSHELRTPLSAVVGFASTLENHGDEMNEAELDEIYARLGANARKLQRLVVDLLDLDRTSRGIVEPKLQLEDLGKLVMQVALEAEQITGRSVAVTSEPVVIPVDVSKVERIIENLLINAARHTPKETSIWVSVFAADGGGVIAVDDEGPGVADEMKEAVFEPFLQVRTERHTSSGVGIGLSLVARFAALHGGRAWVEDRVGGGASFRVFLPGSTSRSETSQLASFAALG